MVQHSLHRPNANLACFQESTVCGGIRISNILSLIFMCMFNNEKAQLKVILWRYLITLFYFTDELLFTKIIHNLIYKLFIIFCTVLILYTLNTWYILYFYGLFHILRILSMHACNICKYVCYVCNCVCVCLYLHMYVCIYGQALCDFTTKILLACTPLLTFEYYEPDLSRECCNVLCLQSHSQRRCPWPGIHPELKSSTRFNRHDRCGGRVNTCQRQMHIAKRDHQPHRISAQLFNECQ